MESVAKLLKIKKYHCLSIGFSNYSTYENEELKSLPSAAFGARAVANKFKSLGFQTNLLENPSVSVVEETL